MAMLLTARQQEHVYRRQSEAAGQTSSDSYKQPSFCVAHNRFLLLLRTVECFEFYIHAVSDESRDSFNSYQMLPFFLLVKILLLTKNTRE